jgi:Zn-dependent protease with chaperone function
MYCPKCGVTTQEDALFCHVCGAKLPRLPGPGSAPGPDGAQPAAQATKPQRVHPVALTSDQYAHPLDRQSLEGIARFAPVVAVSRAISRYWDEPMVKGQLLGGTVKVGPEQFQEIHAVVSECAAILNMAVPDVFIKHDPTFNAMTLGVERPLVILHSSVVEAFTLDELTYIIGHEMGHIKSEHVLYLSAAYLLTMGARGLADSLFGLGSLVVVPAMQALQAWMRKAELTADRAGLICVQDLGLARRALIKLALGSGALFDRLNIDEYLRQADRASRDEYGRVTEFFQTHPHIANRVRELKYFNESNVYQGILGPGSTERSAGQIERLAREGLDRGKQLLNRVGSTVSGFLTYRSSLDRALAEFNHVVERYPATDAAREALYYKGLTHLNLRQGLDAAKALQSFVLVNPLHELAPEAHWGLGLTFERLLKDETAAGTEYRRLLTDFPENARAGEAREALRRLGLPVDGDHVADQAQ